MKKVAFLILSICSCTLCFAQKNFIDLPYIESSGIADTLVTPDRIYISILLNEADSKNKKSLEDQEQLLEAKLKGLGINTQKDLSLNDLSSNFRNYFLKGQNVIKAKNYSLLVKDAITAGKVITELEDAGISNVSIERVAYSKEESLRMELRLQAIKKSKSTAVRLASEIGQKVGRAIHIAENSVYAEALQGRVAGIQIRGTSSLYGSRAEPAEIDFKKIKFEARVAVKYQLD